MYILPSSAIRVSMAARSARCSACVDAVSDTRGELAEVPAKMATKGMLMTMVMTMGAMVLAIYQTGPDAKSDTSMYSKSGPAKRVLARDVALSPRFSTRRNGAMCGREPGPHAAPMHA